MVRTLVVIVGLVALVVLLVPRPNEVAMPTVDVASAAQAGVAAAGFPVSVPRDLPEGWTPTSARVQRGTDGVMTWHLGYVTPSGLYAGVEQAAGATGAWEDRQVTDGREAGTRVIDGRTWIMRGRPDRGIISMVLRQENLTTVVTGRATQAELDELATALPLPPG
jgi:hypothetical protein